MYPEDYDRLLELGRKGRSPEEERRFRAIREDVRKGYAQARLRAAVSAAMDAATTPPAGPDAAPDPPLELELEPLSAASDAGGSPPPGAPPSTEGGEAPASGAAEEAREPIPAGPDAPPSERFFRYLQGAIAADAAFDLACQAADVRLWSPTWLRQAYLAVLVRAADDWRILEWLDAAGGGLLDSRAGRAAVAVAGGPVLYGPAVVALGRTLREMTNEERQAWIAKMLSSAGVRSSTCDASGPASSSSEPAASGPAEPSGSTGSSPPGTADLVPLPAPV